MTMETKLSGDDRREHILQALQENDLPLSGGNLASTMGVSRQVIVQDIALLKAQGLPIIATSQGYIYQHSPNATTSGVSASVAVRHPAEQTEQELLLLVDLGICVQDVTVEHPLYGELTAQLQLRSRRDVRQFIEKMHATGAAYLLELTQGVHLHTLIAPDKATLEEGIAALQDAGILLSRD